jgi:hypothetical protein
MLALILWVLSTESNVRRIERDMHQLHEHMTRALAHSQLQEFTTAYIASQRLDNDRRRLASGADADLLVQRVLQMVDLWNTMPQSHAASSRSTKEVDEALIECWNAMFDHHAVLPRYTPAGLCSTCRVPVIKLRSQAQILCPSCAHMRQDLPSIVNEVGLRQGKPLVVGALAAGMAQQLHRGVPDQTGDTLHPLAHGPLDGTAMTEAPITMQDVVPPSPAQRLESAKSQGWLRPMAGRAVVTVPSSLSGATESGLSADSANIAQVKAVMDTLEQFSESGPVLTQEQITRLQSCAWSRWQMGVVMNVKKEWPAFCEKAGLPELSRWYALGSWLINNPGVKRIVVPDEQIRTLHARLRNFVSYFPVIQSFYGFQGTFNARAMTNLLAGSCNFPAVQELVPCSKTEQERIRDSCVFNRLITFEQMVYSKNGAAASLSPASPSSSSSPSLSVVTEKNAHVQG